MLKLLGTSGYNYKERKGSFYPGKIAAGDMLGYCAERLNCVEINNSFYRVPKPQVVESWVDQVPDSFRFVVTATRRITHIKRLKETNEETEYFPGITAHFGEVPGSILFLLPPFLRGDVDRFKTFVDLLPEETPTSFEFRHDSWYTDEVFDVLRKRNFALYFAHNDDDTDVDLYFQLTADWGYLRLQAEGYSDDDLEDWSDRIEAQCWKTAYVFFKQEQKGADAELASRFTETS